MKTLFRKLSTVYAASLTAVAVAWSLERVSGLPMGSVTTDLFLAFGFCAYLHRLETVRTLERTERKHDFVPSVATTIHRS